MKYLPGAGGLELALYLVFLQKETFFSGLGQPGLKKILN